MTHEPAEFVVAGGGVIGLSIAYQLAREGVAPGPSIVVLDRGRLARAASWAGAGIIAPASTTPPPLAAARLRSRSATLWPGWTAALREETGVDNGYRRCGGLDVALSETEDRALRSCAGRWRLEGIAFERLEGAAIREVEPALTSAALCAYLVPDRAQVRNPWHLRALLQACERRGVRLLPSTPATGFERRGNRIAAVETPGGRIPCGQVVIAAGAWSQGLLGDLGVEVPTPPIKGQIVLLNPGRPTLRRIVELGPNYLVPRDEGRILIGATEENAGFDIRPTTSGVRGLLDLAISLCPALAEAEVETAWAGLRPGSRDTRPYLGSIPRLDNAWVATGHKRAGLQLSPGTAEAMVDLIVGRPTQLPLDDFRVDRETASLDADAFRS